MRSFNRNLDSSFWYYTTVCAPAVVFLVILVLNREVIVSSYLATASLLTGILSFCIIISAMIHWLTSIAGMLGCNDPKRQSLIDQRNFEISGWDADKMLVVSFVSQGFHLDILKNSVSRAHSILSSLGATFQIEVVVDAVALSEDPWFESYGCVVVDVPRSFATNSGAKFKARALCYAAEVRKMRFRDEAHVWILHCDEETLLTRQAVYGIHTFLSKDGSGDRCGAGARKYHPPGSVEVTQIRRAVDFHGTGEELGRYRLQFRLWQASICAAQGSFVLVPIKFDTPGLYEVGERGSLTEDVYVALTLRTRGIPIVWIDGHVVEQSVSDLKNFLRQRARWIHGILNALFEPRFPLRYRLVWLAYLVMWRITICAGIGLLVFSLLVGNSPWLMALWGASITTIGTVLVVGAFHNNGEEGPLSSFGIVRNLLAIVLLAPFICFIETLSMIYAAVCKPKRFHVVDKRLSAGALPDTNGSPQIL